MSAVIDRFGNLLHPEQFERLIPGEPRAGRFFGLIFWGYFAVTYASYLFDDRTLFGVVPVTLAFAALLAVWLILPWRPDVPRYRLLGAPAAFIAVSFVVVHLTGFGLAAGLFSISVANAVFLFGAWRGLFCAVGLLPIIFVGRLWAQPELGVVGSLERTAYWIPTFAFVIGMCAMALEAVQRERQAQELLAELEAAHSELQRYAEQVRELAISEERHRMAREIHDTLGHYLTVVNVQLEAAGKLMDRDPDRALEAVTRAKISASEALSEVRRSVRALKPLAIEERVGVGAFAALAREFGGTGLAVSFETTGEEYELPPEIELLLYRSLQEGLTNALKHSGASRVEAKLAFEPAAVRLTVTDNGCGFRRAGEWPEGGFGLRGLKERAASLGGTITTESADGGGFELVVGLPMSPVRAS